MFVSVDPPHDLFFNQFNKRDNENVGQAAGMLFVSVSSWAY